MADRAGMKRVAILRSCYSPWKGDFDLINFVEEFILYDDCQYTRQDWRKRKTENGTRWLTIPVQVEGLYSQRLNETVSPTRAGARGTGTYLYGDYEGYPDYPQLHPPSSTGFDASRPALQRAQ